MDSRRLKRRALVGGALASALTALFGAACGSPPEIPKPPPLPPLALDKLDKLAAGAGLAWLVRVAPRKIAEIPWLIPAIGQILPEKRLDAFRDRTGLDLRRLEEAWMFSYDHTLGGASVAVVRHPADPLELERKFRERLTADIVRSEDRPDLVRVSGHAGTVARAFARLGKDVAVYQTGGDLARGPARVAALYAMGKLAKVEAALAVDPLGTLFARFGDAPAIAVAPGPFDDELARAARGLLASATGVGAGVRPTARENLGLSLAIAGDFGDRSAEAAEILGAAWQDIALAPFGHLLGLDRPIEAPVTAGAGGVLTLSVEVRPDRLAEGLRALAAEDLDAIMKLD
ncbi:MAG TPA: hypothetical protein VL400_27820 [Polyangiaceae bacterium]|nr:hypothetical protein [Polyangiaceae bacterium]